MSQSCVICDYRTAMKEGTLYYLHVRTMLFCFFSERVAVLCLGRKWWPAARRVKAGYVPRPGVVDLWDVVVKVSICILVVLET
jgi:hypothetical protein